VSGASLSLTLPPRSATLLVIPPAGRHRAARH